jgi:uncharacterized membrane protein YdjX (TVP38/TMEM64 family)
MPVRRLVRAVRQSVPFPGSEFSWSALAMLVTIVGLVMAGVALWRSGAQPDMPSPHDIADLVGPYRQAWYALPIVALVFTVLGLVLVPVLLMIAATGIAFGPWLGPLYAMVGSLSSASVGFAIGRRLGRKRVERLGGRRVARINQALERNGLLAVFFLRKVPAPFMVSNVIIGASRVRYRDFLLGTFLGMIAVVVALAGFGYQISSAFHDPSPKKLAIAGLCLATPLTLAWLINKRINRDV